MSESYNLYCFFIFQEFQKLPKISFQDGAETLEFILFWVALGGRLFRNVNTVSQFPTYIT